MKQKRYYQFILSSIFLASVSTLSSCLTETPVDETTHNKPGHPPLLPNERFNDGNLTWEYLNQFVEPNPTADLTGTWVGMLPSTIYPIFYSFYLESKYVAATNEHHYDSFIYAGSPLVIRTDANFSIITTNNHNVFTQHSASHISFNWSDIIHYTFTLKKISNEHIDIGKLTYSTILSDTQESIYVDDAIRYYQEKWKIRNGRYFFEESKVITVNDDFSTFKRTDYKCTISNTKITIGSINDCFQVKTSSKGAQITFDVSDKESNRAVGGYGLTLFDE